jgi:hypothetical protein
VTYRDDRDADRARIEALEAELAAATKRVAELEHKESTALVRANDGALALTSKPGASTTWFGAPLELELERDIAGTFPVDQFEDLVEIIRATVRDAGRTEILKTSMTWQSTTNPKGTGPFIVITVSVRDGRTRLAISDRLGQLAGAMFGGVGGGVGGGTIVLPIMIGMAITPALIPVTLLTWLGTAWMGSRALFKRGARKRANKLQQLFERLGDEIVTAIAKDRAKQP